MWDAFAFHSNGYSRMFHWESTVLKDANGVSAFLKDFSVSLSSSPTSLITYCRWLGHSVQPVAETLHTGWWAVCNSDGTVVAESHRNASHFQIFWRSTAKFVQALPVIEAGLHHNKSSEQLAVLCSSHVGSELHQSLALGWLQSAGLTKMCLLCGVHPPVDLETRHQLIRNGRSPSALHHNCSGKHSGMLAVCQHHGWPLESYREASHPLQQGIAALMAERLNLAEPLPTGVDGCGVPTFYGTVGQLAQLYAVLTTDPLAEPLIQSVISSPVAFGGVGRVDSEIVKVTNGRLIGKVGADGVFVVMNRDQQLGFAIKIADGHEEARNRVVMAVLQQLDWLTALEISHPSLAAWVATRVENASGTPVGEWHTP